MIERYRHAAREIERFARMRCYEATDPEVVRSAVALLRLAIGVRRNLEKWPDRRTPAEQQDSRRSLTHRSRDYAAASVGTPS
jgi:hypothetical protein